MDGVESSPKSRSWSSSTSPSESNSGTLTSPGWKIAWPYSTRPSLRRVVLGAPEAALLERAAADVDAGLPGCVALEVGRQAAALQPSGQERVGELYLQLDTGHVVGRLPLQGYPLERAQLVSVELERDEGEGDADRAAAVDHAVHGTEAPTHQGDSDHAHGEDGHRAEGDPHPVVSHVLRPPVVRVICFALRDDLEIRKVSAATPGRPVIEVEGLHKLYGDFPAVQGLSFQVGPGEVLGLVGPNGAGKTTTIRSIAGIIIPSAGTDPDCGP